MNSHSHTHSNPPSDTESESVSTKSEMSAVEEPFFDSNYYLDTMTKCLNLLKQLEEDHCKKNVPMKQVGCIRDVVSKIITSLNDPEGFEPLIESDDNNINYDQDDSNTVKI